MCAAIDFDEIRTLIKSGYAEPSIEWNEPAEWQWDLAMRVVIAMAKAYLDSGVSVVLEVFATPHDLPAWKNLLGNLPYNVIVLLPDVEIVLARNSQREGTRRLTGDSVRQNYEWSLDWKSVSGVTVIDNGHKSIGEVAGEILDLSARQS
jgi:hypothetical protein